MKIGEWINPGDDFGGLEILTRSFTKEYTVYRDAKMRQAMRRAGVDIEAKLDPDVRAEIAIQCYLDKMFIDVRGINDTDGKTPLTAERYRVLIWEENYRPILFGAGIRAAGMVGQRAEQDIEDASKNSPTPSDTTSSGQP